jgi:diphosphomevalonate decarboxylase
MYKTSPNIGLVKYWGKWDEKEIIPLNDNIGVTLS